MDVMSSCGRDNRDGVGGLAAGARVVTAAAGNAMADAEAQAPIAAVAAAAGLGRDDTDQ